jgi:hypothetical protein
MLSADVHSGAQLIKLVIERRKAFRSRDFAPGGSGAPGDARPAVLVLIVGSELIPTAWSGGSIAG